MAPVAVPVVPSGRTYAYVCPEDVRTPKHEARHGLNRFDGG